MDYQEMKDKIFKEIEIHHMELIALNDEIADHPEVSGQELETSKKIVDFLNRHGYRTEYPFVGIQNAFRGIYGNDNHTYKVAILVEYDALPEIGHACGHCLSGAISLLAGLAVKDLQDELDTDIHIIGTPDEEFYGQKCDMVKNGVFDNYDMALMIHLYNCNLIAPKLQGVAPYMYRFHGKAAHASSEPWEGINALNAAQLMFHAVDMLRQHCKPDAQFHGIIRNGGTAPNIVPELAEAEIFVRALQKKDLEKLIAKLDLCAEGASIATQTTWEKYPTGHIYYGLECNESGIAALEEVFQELDVEENGNREKTFGSSDIGNVSAVCPCFHPCLQVVDENVPLHSREFAAAMKSDRAHKVLAVGAKVIALQIAKVFSDRDRIDALKKDFERSGI